MYANHVPQIAEYCKQSPENMASMVEFVIATIQQGLSTVPMILEDIDRNGQDSVFLFKNKRNGWVYLHQNKALMYDKVMQADTVEDVVLEFYQIPGIGAVKAGFCAQLLGFNTGCIDSHNLKLLGIPASAVNVAKTLKEGTIMKKIADYVKLTESVGGAEYLWDSWCDYVAGNQANRSLKNGFEVSKLHLECIARHEH